MPQIDERNGDGFVCLLPLGGGSGPALSVVSVILSSRNHVRQGDSA